MVRKIVFFFGCGENDLKIILFSMNIMGGEIYLCSLYYLKLVVEKFI